MVKHSTFVAAVLYMLAASGCGIGLQAVPGASVPDDDDVADDDDSASVGDDDDSTAADDDDSTLADDDDSVDDDDATGDDDDDGGGCTALTALSCGQQISATTLDPGATDNIDTWGCSGWANSGPELSYSFNTNSATTVAVELTSMETGQDLDVYVTSDSGIGCHSGDCAAFGDVEAEFEAAPGIDYFVVVDGYQGAAGTFVLEVTCASMGDDDDSVGDDDDSVGDDDDSVGDDDDATTTGPEVCTNLIDDDGNGLIDCQDPACSTDPACAPPAEDCVNGFDDDGDGLVDCDDPGCSSDPACAAPTENCSNGLDDDGNGLVDCDDSACAADPACQSSGGGGVCVPDWVLVENSTDSWNNGGTGSTNLIDTYSCVGWDESGPEYTYSYTAAATGTATVSVSVSGWLNFDDLDVFVLDGSGACDPNNCVTYGDSSTSWAVTAGSTWFIVVDGYLGDSSDYDLELTFSP